MRRARGRSRRYAKHNEIRYLWTLTYADEAKSVSTVADHWRLFRRSLDREFGRRPWLRCFEAGSKKGRLHVHFGCSDRLEHSTVLGKWDRGHVFVTDHAKGKVGHEVGASVAHYIAAYLGKEGLGSRSYDVARGFAPPVLEVGFSSVTHALEACSATFFGGLEPRYRWESESSEDWRGPEAMFASW